MFSCLVFSCLLGQIKTGAPMVGAPVIGCGILGPLSGSFIRRSFVVPLAGPFASPLALCPASLASFPAPLSSPLIQPLYPAPFIQLPYPAPRAPEGSPLSRGSCRGRRHAYGAWRVSWRLRRGRSRFLRPGLGRVVFRLFRGRFLRGWYRFRGPVLRPRPVR